MKFTLPLKIVIPLVLGMAASLAIAIYAELGFRRLEIANQQMAVALEIQSTLNEALALIVDAETGQRGFLLTGKEEYLEPYTTAVPKIGTAFHKLRELMLANGTMAQRDALGRVSGLMGKKVAELEATLALFRNNGMEVAQALIATGIGRQTMNEIRAEIDALTTSHRSQLAAAANRWSTDIAFARVAMQTVTALTISLLLIVWLLALRDTRQRNVLRRTIEDDKRRLESLVEERTAALSELSNHLQNVREDEKSKLARDIHDELGGILVSAKMDVAWVEERLQARDAQSAGKLQRALQVLDDGVQIKRRIIEELRPTLLDNLGLSAAIDWQVHEICDRAGLAFTIATPNDDSTIPPTISIALFRIVQEALTNVLKYSRAKSVRVDLGASQDDVSLLIEDDGIGIPDDAQSNALSHGIAGMRQRVKALHGDFAIGRRPQGGTLIEVTIPLDGRSQQESLPAQVAKE
ncbi:MAG: CHASE3 domain-containing protein [Casimicrobiaceae bacterium]